MCLAKGTYVRFTIKKGNIGSNGLAKGKHEVQGGLFGYVAYNIQRKKKIKCLNHLINYALTNAILSKN